MTLIKGETDIFTPFTAQVAVSRLKESDVRISIITLCLNNAKVFRAFVSAEIKKYLSIS